MIQGLPQLRSDSDTVAKLYRLNDEINYLISGRIDIGINYEGWSLQEAKDYLNEKGFNGDAADPEQLFGNPQNDRTKAFLSSILNT